MYGVRKCSSFIFLQVVDQFSQHHLLKRLSFLHCIFLPSDFKIINHSVQSVLSGLTEICGLRLCLFSVFTLIHVAHTYMAGHLITYLFEIIHEFHSNPSLKN